MIDLKTAELFSASSYLGGYLSGFSDNALEAATAFARHLGIAYQIYDDAADIFAEEEVAGKTLGTDLATGKFTLPVLIWLDSMTPDDRNATLEGLKSPENSLLDVRQALIEDCVLEKVGEAFFAQIDLAVEAIVSIPGEARQQQLTLLAEFVRRAWNKFTIQ